MSSLGAKIDRLKDEHADEEFNKLQKFHDQQSVEDAMFILGRIKQNDHLGEAIASNLSAQTIMALQRFQQEKKHEALGYETFDQFLNQSRHSPMTKAQYYERLAIVNKHGLDVADLLTSIGISMRSQKLIDKGDIEIRNDTLYVRGTEFEGANNSDVKELIVELVEDRRQATVEKEKLEKKIEKQADQIKRGTEENEELRRSLDEIDETTRFERALMHAVNGQLLLVEAIGELSTAEKKARGADDLKLFSQQYFRLSDAYGVKRSLTDAVPEGDSVADRGIREMIEDGSFEDLDG